MALRVVGLTDHPSALTDEDFLKGSNIADEGRSFVSYSRKEKIIGSALGAGFIILLICSLAFTLITFCLRTKRLRQKHQIEVESQNNSNSGNWTLKRNHSFPSTNTTMDEKRGSRKNPNAKAANGNANANAAIKPLPATPSKSGEKLTKSDVSELLYQLSSQGHSPEPAEYECIPGEVEDEHENENSKKDGVYIVYCCKNKGKRSKSAPVSLRDKKKMSRRSMSVERDTIHDTDDADNIEKSSEESDDSFVTENIGGPGRRTVRSVKRNFQHQRNNNKRFVANKDGAQRLTHGHSHGSFPSVICKRVPGGGAAGTRSYRERKHVNFAETYLREDNISTQLSSEDSAYSGSVSSRFAATSSTAYKPKSGYLKEIQSSIATALPGDDRFQNSAQRLNAHSENSKEREI